MMVLRSIFCRRNLASSTDPDLAPPEPPKHEQQHKHKVSDRTTIQKTQERLPISHVRNSLEMPKKIM